MTKSFRDFLNEDVSADGFSLGPRDAHDTAKNINIIFMQRAKWFSSPKPISIEELCEAYKDLCPDMEIHHPGIVDKIFHPQVITKLGYPVDEYGLVHWKWKG